MSQIIIIGTVTKTAYEEPKLTEPTINSKSNISNNLRISHKQMDRY